MGAKVEVMWSGALAWLMRAEAVASAGTMAVVVAHVGEGGSGGGSGDGS